MCKTYLSWAHNTIWSKLICQIVTKSQSRFYLNYIENDSSLHLATNGHVDVTTTAQS